MEYILWDVLVCFFWEGRIGEVIRDKDKLGKGELSLEFKIVMGGKKFR